MSAEEPNKLAVAAISHIVRFDRDFFLQLYEECHVMTTPPAEDDGLGDSGNSGDSIDSGDTGDLAKPGESSKSGKGEPIGSAPSRDAEVMLTQAQFAQALALVKVHPKDKEIFDRIFVLLDRAGDGCVNYKELVVGSSVLVKGDALQSLKLALELFDHDAKTGQLDEADVRLVLGWVLKISAFFGDKQPTAEALARFVEHVTSKTAGNPDPDPTFMKFINPMLEHPLVAEFVAQADDCERLQAPDL